MSKFKKSLLIMCILSIAGILFFTIGSINTWRSSMLFTINPETSYIIGETDLTSVINYQMAANSYIVGMAFVLFGFVSGLFFDCALWLFYGAVLGIIYIVQSLKKKKKTKFSKQELIDIADEYLERIEELEQERDSKKETDV